MEKIASFTIDHLKLLPGVYVSRKDKVGQQVITTFDIRMTRPNFEPVLNTAEVGTLRSPLTEMTDANAAVLADAMKAYGILD